MALPAVFRSKRGLAAVFLVAGVTHFTSTDFFLKIMPPYLPFHREIVLISGAVEIVLGSLLLIPRSTASSN